jgi:hypothetical protein
MIHNKSIEPTVSESISLLTNTETSISIERSFIYKLGKPYSVCEKDVYKSPSKSFILQFMLKQKNRTYRQKDCLALLLQNYINEKCGCSLVSLGNLHNAPGCAVDSWDCAEETTSDYYKNQIEVKYANLCPVECDSIDYDMTTSLSRPFTNNFQGSLVKRFKTLAKQNYTGLEIKRFVENSTSEYVANSVIQMYVYYNYLHYSQLDELPKYTPIKLVSNIGGALGLFLGVSILSLLELVELIIEIYSYLKK